MRRVLILAFCVCLPSVVFAQQRPLVTEDPETIGPGRVLVEGGFDYGRDVDYPVSGLKGNLLRLPLVGVSIGLSSIAEIQIDGGFHNRLAITGRDPRAPLAGVVDVSGDTAGDVEDFLFATKIRIVPESSGHPSFGFRFATKLPNANNETGLGLDTTDVYGSVLVAKTVQSVRVVGNAGLAILGDPTRGDRQNDVTIYGLSFARALTQAAEVVGEINGRLDTRHGDPPPGTESRGMARFGARYTIGSWRGDAALLFGLTSHDPGVGFAAGFTYIFNAFQVP
jgi:hypothetical protein